jgi:hypothetical protein
MNKTFIIELENFKIDYYEEILCKFSNWKEYKREININLLLEHGKKIQFDVEIINNPMVFYVSVCESEYQYITSLTNVCSAVNRLTFIILDSKVIKLEVELKLLDTKWGKIIKNLIESNIELKLSQNINIKGQVDNFYFELPKQAA